MTSIGPLAALKLEAVRLAGLTGDAKFLSKQEVNEALSRGEISKAQSEVLKRALPDDGQGSLDSVFARFDRDEEDWAKPPAAGDHDLAKAERAATAQAAVDSWLMLLGAPAVSSVSSETVGPAGNIQVDWASPAGDKLTSALGDVGSLQEQVESALEAALNEADAARMRTNLEALQHQVAMEIAQHFVA
jgi:hypothetical protein